MPSLPSLWYLPVKLLECWSHSSCGREISLSVKVTTATQECKSCEGSQAKLTVYL